MRNIFQQKNLRSPNATAPKVLNDIFMDVVELLLERVDQSVITSTV